MFVPTGVAGDALSAVSLGRTVSDVQKPVSGLDAVRGIGTAADVSVLVAPGTAPIAGPIGVAADITEAVLTGSPAPLVPMIRGKFVKDGVRGVDTLRRSEQFGAGTELVIGTVIDVAEE